MKSWMPKIAFGVLLVVVMSARPSWASDNAGAFARKGMQPKSMALGLGYTAMAEGSEGVFWNPGVLGVRASNDVAIMANHAYETSFLTVSALWAKTPIKLPIGLSVSYAGATGINETTMDSETQRLMKTGNELSYGATAILLGTGKQVSEKVSIGLTGKVLAEKAGGYLGKGWGVDMGLLYRMTDDLRVGISVRNAIKPEMKWDTPSKNTDIVPREAAVGVAYNVYRNKVFVTGDYVMRDHRQAQLQGGMEYRVFPFLPIWLGMNREDMSVGTGLEVGTFSVAFSWTKPGVALIEDIYRFGVKVKW